MERKGLNDGLVEFGRKLGFTVVPFYFLGRNLFWIRAGKRKRLLFNGSSLDANELKDFLCHEQRKQNETAVV